MVLLTDCAIGRQNEFRIAELVLKLSLQLGKIKGFLRDHEMKLILIQNHFFFVSF